MENQDKIYEQFKNAVQKSEATDFPAMEKVWSRVEDKLDKKEDKKVIALWKKLAVAASLLLFLSLGYQFFKMSSVVVTPSTRPEKNVATADSTKIIKSKNAIVAGENPKPIIKKDAGKILERQISKQQQNAVVDGSANSNSNRLKTTKSSNLTNDDLYQNPKAGNAKKEYAVSEIKQEKDADKIDNVFDKKEIAANAIGLATQKNITGVVSDATGPIPGAVVTVKGTSTATQTDLDGKYTITAKEGEELVFSFVGMKEAVAVVGNDSRIDGRLSEGAQLDEVVVTSAYGVKRNVTNAAYTIKKLDESELIKPTKQVEELLDEQELENFLNQNLERKVNIKDKFLILDSTQISNLDGVITNTQIHIDLKKRIIYTIKSNHGLTTLKMHLKEPNSGIINMQFSFKNPNIHLLDLAIMTMKEYQVK